jgi:hypothetical protein
MNLNRSDFLLCKAHLLRDRGERFTKILNWLLIPEAPFALERSGTHQCLLIGDVFSSVHVNHERREIAKELSKANETKEFLHSIRHLTGRFVAILFEGDHIQVFGDAMGQFEVYHDKDCSVIASSLAVMGQVIDLKPHSGQKKELYDQIDTGSKIQIGYTTKFENAFHLMPNHLIDSEKKDQVRYYPTVDDLEEKRSLEEGATSIARALELYAQSISRIPNLSIPVTGGNDSRILLGAFRKHQFDCFIFDHPDSNRAHRDIRVAKKLLASQNKKLRIIKYKAEFDDEGKEFYSDESRLPRIQTRTYIWNAYHKYLKQNYVLVGYGGEIGRSFFKNIKNPNARMFAALMGYPGNPVVIEEMQKWIDKIGADLLTQENIMDWFYWEQRMGNWGARLMTEVAYVADQVSPMNSRFILETMLMVPKKHRQFTGNDLTERIIKSLDPSLLTVSINPSLKYRIIWLMVKFGVYDFYQNIRLRVIANRHK